MTAPLNPSLGLVIYQQYDGSHMASCFVGDLSRDLEEQAKSYLLHEGTQYIKITDVYWHNALEDEYGNRYEPGIKQIG